MASGAPRNVASPLGLEFPQSLAVYDDYAAAQKAVDFLADKEFPVQNCMIVGTDLKRVERITGRLPVLVLDEHLVLRGYHGTDGGEVAPALRGGVPDHRPDHPEEGAEEGRREQQHD